MSKEGSRPALGHEVAISSRVRLARNLEAYPFTTRMSRLQGAEILEKVREALLDDAGLSGYEFSYLEMQSLKPLDRQLLVEKHLISPEFAEGNAGRAAIISKDGRISVMVNEEDHLRLQCIYSGMQLEEAWKLCGSLGSNLDKKLGFAFDKSYGYLTCCPTNIGTGIRASVMLHLPALSMTGYIKGVLETCGKIGVAVRGLYGENSEAEGNMFQISNQVTLGQTEEEIIAGISNITQQISEQEKMLRIELYRQNPVRFEDKIYRSLGLLRSARLITSEESLKLISDVRLGMIMGLLQGMELEDLNELTLMIRPAYLQKTYGEQLKPDERDQKRAELIRKKLNERIH
ncbi:MAG: protein arginine kinase [Clostridiaceae bacterium]|jgi:protein arginine kinase|nr:protein arginine kinase [Clostridiaceae bacterium]